MRTRITREIGIDMGHRVSEHEGKCKSLHGHRYRILATLSGEVSEEEGHEHGMLMDFGFLKQMLMDVIDTPCDHGTTLWINDPLLPVIPGRDLTETRECVERDGYCATEWMWGKLYVVNFTPTAENLARHWFERCEAVIATYTDQSVLMGSMKVYETPNCFAKYSRP